jgi:PleD family two-component response regulator
MEEAPIDVCIIEDDPAQRELLLRRLLREQLSVIEAHDGREGLEQIRRHHPRVVISDLDMPGVNGFELSRQVRSDASIDDTYLIVVTSSESREVRHRLLHAGADDFLVKPCDLVELLARVRNGLRVRQLQERLRRAALTDGLTGLWNHAHFRGLLDREFARTRRYGGEVALIMLDLDHFKAVNDTYGHEVGNRVLQATACYLERMVRDTDLGRGIRHHLPADPGRRRGPVGPAHPARLCRGSARAGVPTARYGHSGRRVFVGPRDRLGH